MPLQHHHDYAAGLHRGLPTGDSDRSKSSPHNHIVVRVRVATQPRSTRFELVAWLEGLSNIGSSRTPFRLACRTRTIWQYWSVPALSGLLPTLTPIPGIRLPSASTGSLRRADGGVLSSPHGSRAPRGAPSRSTRCHRLRHAPMKQGSFALDRLCCPARHHYYDPLRLPLDHLTFPGITGYRQTRSRPRRVGAEEGLSSSLDNLLTVPRPLRRRVHRHPLQDPGCLPWPSPNPHRLGTLSPAKRQNP